MVDNHDGIKCEDPLNRVGGPACHFRASANFILALPKIGFRNS
jgi:hypothetical protein